MIGSFTTNQASASEITFPNMGGGGALEVKYTYTDTIQATTNDIATIGSPQTGDVFILGINEGTGNYHDARIEFLSIDQGRLYYMQSNYTGVD